MTVSCVVPGRTVLRITTTWYAALVLQAAPTCSHTRVRCVRSRLPFRRLGVLTEMSDSSLASIASVALVVARRRPAATLAATSSGKPGSTIGL